MSRYIDADKFNRFDYESDRGNEFDSPREAYIQGVEYVLGEIDATTTADVQEVKHGRWIDETEIDDDRNVTTTCNLCFHTDTHREGLNVPYCWFCGAIMDGDNHV